MSDTVMKDGDGMEFVQRHLFGGAVTVQIQRRFVDVSQFRQVPDNQEVFADALTDQSVIVEVLELEAGQPDDTAAEFHFGSIAHDNDATEHSLEQTLAAEDLNPEYNGTRSSCFGMQKVAKFNELEKFGEEAGNQVRVYVSTFRLKDVTTDLVLSFNSPVQISDKSSSASMSSAEAVEEKAEPMVASEDFNTMTSSLKVVDFGLFGG
eukprot:m.20034 g.20034  ORF g.20034 m.20034 type:complete len:207 (-) comp10103_c1_seq1:9-629(-)